MAKNEFLKECIADAFLILLKEKSPEKITAQAIAKEAGVGRATYFRNFNSKEETLTFALVNLWNRWTNERIDSKSVRNNVEDFFQFNYENKELIKRIYEVHYEQTIYKAFFQILNEYPSYNPLEAYLTRFAAYGLFGLLEEWVSRDFAEEPATLAEFVENHVL
ncbi:MAG: TetR/AcrR family transcriptional regulator [Firmicutes bacterium]|nr:TetR/AcrR family transcriptional regulator [Bacillota bacterium]